MKYGPPILGAVASLLIASGNAAPLDVLGTVDVGIPAYRVALTPDGGTALVTRPGGAGTLTFIDVAGPTGTDIVALPGATNAGMEIDVAPDGTYALVTNYSSATLIQVDLATASVVGAANIGVQSSGVTIVPQDDRFALVVSEESCGGGHCLTVFQATSGTNWASGAAALAGHEVGIGPRMVALTPDGLTALVPNGNSATLSVLTAGAPDAWATATVAATLPLSGQPSSVAITPDGLTALVTDANTSSLFVVEAPSPTDWASASVAATLSLPGCSSSGVAITPDGREAVVACGGASKVILLSAPSPADWPSAAVTATSPTLSGTPLKVAIDAAQTRAVVSRFHGGQVSVLELVPPVLDAWDLDPPGDVNADGAVDVLDVQCAIGVAKWALFLESAPPAPTCTPEPGYADLDCDGEMTIDDIKIAILWALGGDLPNAVDADESGVPDSCETP